MKKRKGSVRRKPSMRIDMHIKIGNEKVFKVKGAKEKDVIRSLETLMQKYGCECE